MEQIRLETKLEKLLKDKLGLILGLILQKMPWKAN